MIIGEIKPDYVQDKGLLEIKIEQKELKGKKRDTAAILLESFLIGILDIQDKYPGSIDIITIEN